MDLYSIVIIEGKQSADHDISGIALLLVRRQVCETNRPVRNNCALPMLLVKTLQEVGGKNCYLCRLCIISPVVLCKVTIIKQTQVCRLTTAFYSSLQQ